MTKDHDEKNTPKNESKPNEPKAFPKFMTLPILFKENGKEFVVNAVINQEEIMKKIDADLQKYFKEQDRIAQSKDPKPSNS